MKLSEAILLGSVGTEQCCFALYRKVGKVEKTCAIGAALFAVCGSKSGDAQAVALAHALWPWANQCRDQFTNNLEYTGMPIVKMTYSVFDEIMLLNDVLGWTRPQIAEWVKSIEPDEVQHDTNLSCPDTHEVPTSQVS